MIICPFTLREGIRLRYESHNINIFIFMARLLPVGQSLPAVEGSRSHSDTPHSAGFLCTSDQPDAETSTSQRRSFIRKTSLPPARFEPTIPASAQPQTHAFDRAATGIGKYGNNNNNKNNNKNNNNNKSLRSKVSRSGNFFSDPMYLTPQHNFTRDDLLPLYVLLPTFFLEDGTSQVYDAVDNKFQ
jgi:hypothetical protein